MDALVLSRGYTVSLFTHVAEEAGSVFEMIAIPK